MSNVNVKEAIYRHITLKGSSYEIGRKEAELLQKYYPAEVGFFFKGSHFIKPAPKESIKKTMKLFEQFCPNVNEEIKALHITGRSGRSIYYSFACVSKGTAGSSRYFRRKPPTEKYLWEEL